MKNCIICNKLFKPKSNQKTCSMECSEKNRKAKHKKRNKNWYQKNREEILKKNKVHYNNNREERLKKQKEYNQENERTIKQYREDPKNRTREKTRRQKPKNKVKKKTYQKQKRKNDLNYHITYNLRSRSNFAIQHYITTGKIMSSKQYGINYPKIIEHLKPFPNDMENYNIHHIIPLRSFNLENEDGSANIKEVKMAMAPENHKLLSIEEHNKLNHFELVKKIMKFGGGSFYVKQFGYKI